MKSINEYVTIIEKLCYSIKTLKISKLQQFLIFRLFFVIFEFFQLTKIFIKPTICFLFFSIETRFNNLFSETCSIIDEQTRWPWISEFRDFDSSSVRRTLNFLRGSLLLKIHHAFISSEILIAFIMKIKKKIQFLYRVIVY